MESHVSEALALSLASAYAEACRSGDPSLIQQAQDRILNALNVATPTDNLEQALAMVAACPGVTLAEQTLAAQIQSSTVSDAGGGNAMATASGAKAVVINEARDVFMDGKKHALSAH